MSREAAEVARKAAEIIQQRGKATGHLEDEEGRVCLHGALMHAKSGYDYGTRLNLISELDDKLVEKFPDDDFTMYPGANWNDREDTTERDVAKLLLQVADELEVAP